MSQNLQLQKTVNIHARRIRHRRQLITTDGRFRSRHPGLDNFLTREATRANATPLRLAQALAIDAGGATYAIGDEFLIVGGTFSIQGRGIVTAVSAGVVTGARVIDPGEYTVNPGAAAVTSGAGDDNLTVDTTLTTAVAGVTDQELLDGLRAQEDVGGTVPIVTKAAHFRNARQTSVTYTDNGVPIS